LLDKKKGFYLKEKFLAANESIKSLTITHTSKRINTDIIENFDKIIQSDFVMQKHPKDEHTVKSINADEIENALNSDKIKRTDLAMQNAPVDVD
ncbi:33423_t:CDS:1, partial [Racocetra persica]